MLKRIDPELRAGQGSEAGAGAPEEYPSPTEAMVAVAKRLGVSRESVRRWIAQAEVDAGDRPGVSSEEHEEIKKLKADNRLLREDVATLKATTSFFVFAGTLRGVRSGSLFLRCCGGPRRSLLVRCAARPDALAVGRGVA